MIRRLFWVIVGALLGVTGYRRVSRLARMVGMGGRMGAAPRCGASRPEWACGAARFARDVREGMELYTDRHPRLAGRTLEGQRARPHPTAAGEPRQRRARPGTDYAKDGR
ncbi:MAG TPA: hypothetical protein VMI33_24955 [Streptosporangiaceae bacterium]|nr:hypothetical protein [Streptosporangiaceae bacterium]